MARFEGWRVGILKGLGAPLTPANMRFLDLWQRAEGGNAAFNPLNTTQTAPGAGSYNSVGVRNYISPQQGLQSTLRTLQNGRYQNIVGGLRSGSATPVQLAQALAASPWGTGAGVLRLLGENSTMVPKETIDYAKNVATIESGTNPGATPPPDVAAQMATRFTEIQRQMQPKAELTPLEGLGGLAAKIAKGFADRPPMQIMVPKTQLPPGTPQGVNLTSTGDKAVGKSIVAVVDTALKQLGVPYVWGGRSPKGFDCSGLLQWAYAQHGISVPGTSETQWQSGTKIKSLAQAHPGDAFFYHMGKGGPGHVAMYVGGGKVVVAPHTGDHVRVVRWDSIGGFVGIRRLTGGGKK